MLTDTPALPGKIFPLTVLTPVRRAARWVLRLILVVFQIASLQDVRNLQFIHFARWVRMRRETLPHLDASQPIERYSGGFLLFSSNYNGPWDAYIDAFSRVSPIRRGIRALWFAGQGFPGAQRLRTFKRYIRYHEQPLDAYYVAYPHASVRDIAAALRVQRRLFRFGLEVANVDPPQFHARYLKMLNEVANDLRFQLDTSRIPRFRDVQPDLTV